MPAAIPYTERVFLITSRTLELLGQNEMVSMVSSVPGSHLIHQALSAFIGAGLKLSGYPTPFCFPLEPLLRLLSAGYQRYTLPAYLESMRHVIQTYSIKAPSPDNPQQVDTVKLLSETSSAAIDVSLQKLTNPSQIDELPDLTVGLAEFLSKLINMGPHSYLMLPEAAHHAIINFGILGLNSQDRNTIRIMATFLNELFILEKREAQYARALQLNAPVYGLMVNSYGCLLLRQILQCIGSTMPRSYLGLITEMFRKFLSVHHQEAATWLPSLLSQVSVVDANNSRVHRRGFLPTTSMRSPNRSSPTGFSSKPLFPLLLTSLGPPTIRCILNPWSTISRRCVGRFIQIPRSILFSRSQP